MPGSRDTPQVEVESVRHLIELGYVDPDEVAARKVELRQKSTADLARAMELHAHDSSQDAVALLEGICANDPDWHVPRQRLAEIHYNAGRWAEAQAQLDWLAHHGADYPRSALIAGGIALVQREIHTALEELQYARHVEPNLPSAHTLVGTVLLRLGRWDEAENALREAAQQNPNDARARDGLAAVCLKHGEYEDAADWALRALEQDMRLFRGHYHLGLALAHLDRPSEALQALERSTQVDPSRTAPYRWLSRIAGEMLGDPIRAAWYRERARDIIRQRRQRRGRQQLL